MYWIKQLFVNIVSLPSLLLMLALALMYWQALPNELFVLDQFILEFSTGSTASTSVTPLWYESISSVLWCCAIIYLLVILPRLSLYPALLTSFLIIAALLMMQVIVQLRQDLWVPLGLIIQYLLFSTPVVIAIAMRKRVWKTLEYQRDHALMELAQVYITHGQLDKAFARLSHCSPSKALAELAYQLGVQQEQRRAYAAASTTYQWLAEFAPDFQDINERIKTVAMMLSPTSTVDAFAKTQPLPAINSNDNTKPLLGRYEIQHELGRGAMGIVYLGIDPKISRQVAIKTLSYALFPDEEVKLLKDRFFREAEAAGRLSHPNIITVHDVGEEADLSFIAMDYFQGQSLENFTDQKQLLPVKEVYQIMLDVALALDYAHQQQIVHRDIKPSNLLYDRSNKQVKVSDFGIARIVDDSKTKTGDILGSPIYMSPEQVKGQKIDGRSDVYSLGITFYQLLTGYVPFSGDSLANLAYNILNKKAKSVRELRTDLPASSMRIINKAIAKDSSKRYETPALMAQALSNAIKKDFK